MPQKKSGAAPVKLERFLRDMEELLNRIFLDLAEGDVRPDTSEEPSSLDERRQSARERLKAAALELALLDAQINSRELQEGRAGVDFSQSWLRANFFLAVLPTLLLVGMYGAAAFSLLALGPAWLGFLVGAAPVALLGLWACGGRAEELST